MKKGQFRFRSQYQETSGENLDFNTGNHLPSSNRQQIETTNNFVSPLDKYGGFKQSVTPQSRPLNERAKWLRNQPGSNGNNMFNMTQDLHGNK